MPAPRKLAATAALVAELAARDASRVAAAKAAHEAMVAKEAQESRRNKANADSATLFEANFDAMRAAELEKVDQARRQRVADEARVMALQNAKDNEAQAARETQVAEDAANAAKAKQEAELNAQGTAVRNALLTGA